MEQYPICRHIKTNGLQCHAPALTGGQWCYFHNRLHTRHSRFRPNDANREYFSKGRDLELCALEDRESVQLAISVVINALATNAIETKRATALLYGLQLASMNTARSTSTRSLKKSRMAASRGNASTSKRAFRASIQSCSTSRSISRALEGSPRRRFHIPI